MIGIVFILHAPGEAEFASKVAQSLEPFFAVPMPFKADLSSPSVMYGSAATCVVLLDRSLAAYGDAIARMVSQDTTVVCRGADVVLPGAFSDYCVVERQSCETAALRDAVDRKIREATARDGARRTSYSPMMRGATVRDPAKSSMLTRSAWGLAATFVVAGVAAPVIGSRAGASSVADASPRTDTAEASDVMLVAQPTDVSVQPPQQVEPPSLADLLDHIDRNTPAPVETISDSDVAQAPVTTFTAPSQVSVEIKPETQIAVVAFVEPKREPAAQTEVAAEKPRAASATLAGA